MQAKSTVIMAVAAVLAIASAAPGGTYVWTGPTTGNWSDFWVWTGGVPSGSDPGDILEFTANIGPLSTEVVYTATQDISTPFFLNTLTLGGTHTGVDSTTGTAVINNVWPGGSLLLTAGTGTLNLTAVNGTNSRNVVYDVTCPVTFGASANITGSGTATFNFNSVALPASAMTFTTTGSARANFLNDLALAHNLSFAGAGSGGPTFAGVVTLSDNIVFDVAGSTTPRFTGSITEVGGSRSITKTGAGTLTYTSNTAPTHSGGTTVTGGTLRWNYSGAASTVAWGTGTIRVDGGSFVWNAGGATPDTTTLTNGFEVLGVSSIGAGSTTGKTFNYSGALSLAGHLTFGKLDGGGGGAPGSFYTGTVTIDQATSGLRRITLMSGGNHGPTVSGNIVDGPGGAANPLTLAAGDSGNGRDSTVSGTANTYAGGTIIASGTRVVIVAATSSLGTGPVTVEPGGILLFNADTNLDASRTSLTSDGEFRVNYGGTPHYTVAGSGKLNKSGGGATLLAVGNTYTGGTIVSGSALDAPTLSEYGTGNINLSGGALVLDGSPGSGKTWADFIANRSAGYGTGANQWQLTGGGFAARGGNVTIGATGTTNKTFDRDFVFGSSATLGGSVYADKSVIITQEIDLSAATNRYWRAIGANAESSSNWTLGGPVHEIAGLITGGDAARTLTLGGNGGNNSTTGGTIRLTNPLNSFRATVQIAYQDSGGSAVVIATDDGVFGDAANLIRVQDTARGSDGLLLFEDLSGKGKEFARPFSVQSTDASGGSTGFGSYAGKVIYKGTVSLTGTNKDNVPVQVRQDSLTLGTALTAATIDNGRGKVVYLHKGMDGELVLSNVVYSGANAQVWRLHGGTLTTTIAPATLGTPGGQLRSSGAIDWDDLFNQNDASKRLRVTGPATHTYTGVLDGSFRPNSFLEVTSGVTLTTNMANNEDLQPGSTSALLRKTGPGTWVYYTNRAMSGDGSDAFLQIDQGTLDASGSMGKTRFRLNGGTLLVGAVANGSGSFGGTGSGTKTGRNLEITSAGGKIGISALYPNTMDRSSTITSWDQNLTQTLTLAARDSHDLIFSSTTFPDIAALTTLLIERDGTGTGLVQINDTAIALAGKLGGSGTLKLGAAGTGTLTATGTVAPGSSIGTLRLLANLVFDTFSTYQVELGGAAADRLDVTGKVTLAGELQVTHLSAPAASQYLVLTATGGITGAFAGVGSPGAWNVELRNTDTELWLVPEPATLALMGAGLMLAALRRRKR